MSAAAEPRSVVVEREMSCPPEKLWRALTEPHLIAEWLMQNDFAPKVGHAFQFRGQYLPNGALDCEVLVVEPNKTLSYTWAAFGFESVVVWTLTPTEGGTQLRMEQSGFRSEEDANYKGAVYGWQRFIDNLDRVVGGLED